MIRGYVQERNSHYFWAVARYFALFVVVNVVFVRFILADESVSLDYRHYIEFINEMNEIGCKNLFERFKDGFPYISWGGSGAFEFGFAFVIFPLSKLVPPGFLYAFIVSVTLVLKLNILFKSKVSLYRIILFFIFSVTLFEANAIRAGIASLFLMAGIKCYLDGRRLRLACLYFWLASSFHVSSLLFLVMIFVAWICVKFNIVIIGSIILISVSSIVVNNFSSFLSLYDGKIGEYYNQAEVYGFNSGASGLNLSSLMCLLFGLFFIDLYIKVKNNKNVNKFKKNVITAITFGIFCSALNFVLIAFSGIFAVLGDRVWQLSLPLFILISAHIGSRFIDSNTFFVISSKSNFIRVLVDSAINVILFYYVVINLLIRYPLSNVFSWLTGIHKLVPIVGI